MLQQEDQPDREDRGEGLVLRAYKKTATQTPRQHNPKVVISIYPQRVEGAG